MTIYTRLLSIGTLGILLAGCSLQVDKEVNTGPLAHLSLHQKQLANGKTITIGYAIPEAQWDCSPAGATAVNKMTAETKGMLSFSGTHGYLDNQALDFANKNSINANYVFIQQPTGVSINDWDLTSNSNINILYFNCKNLPKK